MDTFGCCHQPHLMDIQITQNLCTDTVGSKIRRMVFVMFFRLWVTHHPLYNMTGILTLTPDFAHECMKAGASFVAVGLDLIMLVGAADKLAADFRKE